MPNNEFNGRLKIWSEPSPTVIAPLQFIVGLFKGANMPTIAAQFIKKPRKVRNCEICKDNMPREQFRLFGSAYKEAPKYAVYICDNCARNCKGDAVLERVVRGAGMTPFHAAL